MPRAPERRDERGSVRPALLGYIAALGVLAAGITWLADAADLRPPVPGAAWTLPLFAGLLVAAEYLLVRFRFRGEVNALNLIEAVLAPMLFAFEAPVVVLTVVVAQIGAGVLRRNQLEKLSFNVAQWALAAASGAAILHGLPLQRGVSWGAIGGLLLALAAVGVVNQSAFTGVIALADRRSPRAVLRGLVPVIPGWVAGWVVNVLTGSLLVLAFAVTSWAVLLFPVPLVVLHLAYRGYAGARTDRVRLAGIPLAAQALSAPLDPRDGIEEYLREVAGCFEASAAELVLRRGADIEVHRVECQPTYRYTSSSMPANVPSLRTAVLGSSSAARVTVAGDGPLAEQLTELGHRDCLAAPLAQNGAVLGALLIFDQAGLEGFERGELAVVESLARETAATLGKGRVVSALIAERRRLDEIVSSASDGIFTLDRRGIVQSWNPAMERITGIPGGDVVGRPDGLASVGFRRPDGGEVRVDRWATEGQPPGLLEISSRRGGGQRLLSCASSVTRASGKEAGALIVIARDMTPDLEMATLRAEFDRLSRAEAAHRVVVDRLQEAIMPPAPRAQATELGVRYLPSDPSAPTGGDLYDWQVLPDGDVYLSVVDVLGHGVSATKNALSVVHALRTLVLQDRPLDEVIGDAHSLLAAHDPDLVATAMIARFTPSTGALRIAAGGHPPALIVSPEGGVKPVVAGGGAIGWPGAGSEGMAELQLRPGDALVLYTDGLVESGKDIIEGEENLRRHLRELIGTAAEEMADQVLARALADGERRDDSLVLVLRRSPAVERTSWRIAPSPADATRVRREAIGWLDARGIADDVVSDIGLVCSELLSNAVSAARATVTVRLEVEEGAVTIEVEDDGPGDPDLAHRGGRLPDELSEAGRGLYLVRAIGDDVSALSTDEGSSVRVVKRVPGRAERPAASPSDQAPGYIEPT